MIENGTPLGPMGWGIENEPVEKWLTMERRAYEQIAAVAPKYLMRAEPKEPNKKILSDIQSLQKQNGIDAGFCFLFLAAIVHKQFIPWLAQLIGSCVASGDVRTTTYRMMTEVYLLNDPESLPGEDLSGRKGMCFFAPFNYRAGRREAGINGFSDGSLCLPHIKGKMKYGHLPCSTPGLNSDAFPEPQDTSTYKEWGAKNTLMDQFASEASRYALLNSEKVTDTSDATFLMTELFQPFNICSSWSFVPDYEHLSWDITGKRVWIYKRGRQPWHHNMSVVGIVEVGGKWFVIIENSWGNAHKNGTFFVITIELFGEWLKSAQCQSVGEIDLSDNESAWPESAV